MLRQWTKILPFFLVELLAKTKDDSTIAIGEKVYHVAYENTLIEADDKGIQREERMVKQLPQGRYTPGQPDLSFG